MTNKTCYIIAAGENHNLDFVAKKDDLIIAADGGYNHLQKQNIKPDLIIGDLDSISHPPPQMSTIPLNSEKDFTDTFEAIKIGIEKGYNHFQIYCGTGGRFDHTYANIQTLAYLSQKGKRGYLIDKDSIITTITNESITFDSSCKGYISVFSYSNISTGVFLKGLKYTKLENNQLTSTCPIGVSNEFIGEESTISVTHGTLVVIFPRKYKPKGEQTCTKNS